MSGSGLSEEDRGQLLSFGDYGEHALESIDSLTAQAQRDFALAAEWKERAEAHRIEATEAQDRLRARDAVIARVRAAYESLPDIPVSNVPGSIVEFMWSVRTALAAAPEATAPLLMQTPEEMGGQDARMKMRRDLAAANARAAEFEAALVGMREKLDACRELHREANARADAAELDRDKRRGELVVAGSEATALRAELTRERDEARKQALAEAGHAIRSEDRYSELEGIREETAKRLERAESEVTRLTRERDEARMLANDASKHVTRLTEALAAAEARIEAGDKIERQSV